LLSTRIGTGVDFNQWDPHRVFALQPHSGRSW